MATWDIHTGHMTIFKNEVAYTLLTGYKFLHPIISKADRFWDVKWKKKKDTTCQRLQS